MRMKRLVVVLFFISMLMLSCAPVNACCLCIGSVYPIGVMTAGSGLPDHVSVEIASCTGSLMNITLYENSSGGWKAFNASNNLANGTYHFYNVSWINSYDTIYYIRINVNGNCTIEKTISFHTDTNIMDMVFDNAQLGIILSLFLFAFFMWIGYTSQKRSGGAFMLISGFMLIYLGIVLVPYTSAIYVIPLITPIAIFIIMIGIRKWLYPPEKEKTKTEAQ